MPYFPRRTRPPIEMTTVDLKRSLRRKIVSAHAAAVRAAKTTRKYEVGIRVRERIRVLKQMIDWVEWPDL